MEIGVTTRIPQALKEWLDREAKQHNRSLAKEVRHILEKAKSRQESVQGK